MLLPLRFASPSDKAVLTNLRRSCMQAIKVPRVNITLEIILQVECCWNELRMASCTHKDYERGGEPAKPSKVVVEDNNVNTILSSHFKSCKTLAEAYSC